MKMNRIDVRVVNRFNAARLRQVRKNKDKTLKDVAEGTGISLPFISELERGITNPSIETLVRLANYYQIEVANLFDITHERTQ